MLSHTRPLVLLAMLAGLSAGVGLAQTEQGVAETFQTAHDREFDFWMGEWDVVLRVRQEDNSWRDTRFSRAKIYRILDGKAILELWDEQTEGAGIRGYSLRHFDADADEWILYLNWPGPNRSGTSSLRGRFRHGRGEFFSTSTGADGAETINRYTFSDAAPDRLRWDDAYSRDGGRTWSGNWIMEFSRTADRAAFPSEGERAHTYYTGARCDRPEFRTFERLAGTWTGALGVRLPDGSTRRVPASMVAHKILDGCAVMRFLSYELDGVPIREFGLHTFNTYAEVYEEGVLDNRRGTPFALMYGGIDGDGFRVATRAGVDPARRHRWVFSEGIATVVAEERIAGEWVPRVDGTLARER